jgi:hypothetical protein
MKQPSVALAFLLSLTCLTAIGKPCPSLAYEEMKDMTPDELKKAACTAWRNADESNEKAFKMNMSKGEVDQAALEALETERDRCHNEVERIKRVLAKKDSTEIKYETTCAKF